MRMRGEVQVAIFTTIFMLGTAGCSAFEQLPLGYEQEAMRLIDRGTVFLRQGELSRAQAAFELSHNISEIPESYDGLGCVAFLQGDYSAAESLFNSALVVNKSYAPALNHLGMLAEVRGENDRAMEFYAAALELSPLDPRIRVNRAALNYNQGQYPVAFDELLKADVLEKHPLIEDNLMRSKEP